MYIPANDPPLPLVFHNCYIEHVWDTINYVMNEGDKYIGSVYFMQPFSSTLNWSHSWANQFSRHLQAVCCTDLYPSNKLSKEMEYWVARLLLLPWIDFNPNMHT